MNILFLANMDFANVFGEWVFAMKKYCEEKNIYNEISYIQLQENGNLSHSRGKEYNKKNNYADVSLALNISKTDKEKINKVGKIYSQIFSDYIIKHKVKTIIIEDYVNWKIWWYKLILYNCKTYYEKDNSLKFIIFHNGSFYRSNYDYLNHYDKDSYIYKVLYSPDLFRLGDIDQNKKLVINPTFYVEYKKEMIIKKFKKEKLTIFHCPYIDKGTNFIKQKINNLLIKYNLQDKYEFNTTSGITFEEVIELKKHTHIYIGQFCDGKHSSQNVGGYGLSSIEALATGNIVLNLNHKIPLEIIGTDFPIIDLENETKFENIVLNLLLKDKKELQEIAIKSFEYFQENIGYKSIYKKFVPLL